MTLTILIWSMQLIFTIWLGIRIFKQIKRNKQSLNIKLAKLEFFQLYENKLYNYQRNAIDANISYIKFAKTISHITFINCNTYSMNL